ncbi:MAG TPA: asparagine synthase (glutamine-hydrolyzing) [Thermoleophilaceae bacterium]|nr:asparagine synthase (glutamine-hydrolyzing) [Thermoleophilaceae bacterium]
MCGIAGKIDFRGPVDEALLHRMCAAIEHRGPDSRGVFVDAGVGLGIQRLAIIDVEGGDQPIFNEDRTLAVVMNGEIYNFPELRSELIRRGHRFSSRSDTEVLVHLYEEHGEQMVGHLRGMFAFAIWDQRRRRLFCARDRVGKKPLFWARDGACVWFASEIRALLEDPALGREVDLEAIGTFLALQYVPHPMSAFKGIRKLPPASTLVIDEHGEEIRRYWTLDRSEQLDDVPVPELEERLWEEIREATRIRLMSEVPLGAFLSGGIDSTAVVAAMAEQMTAPVKTFTIGFKERAFDELAYARVIAEQFGTDHHELVVEPDALEIMPKLARHFGEPFSDSSAIPTFYLAEMTSGSVTVALNGDGGDETFGGYARYLTHQRMSRLARLPWRPLGAVARAVGEGPHRHSFRTRANRASRLFAMDQADRYASWFSAFDDVGRERLFTPELAASLRGDPADHLTSAWRDSDASVDLDRMMATDVAMYLPGDLLVKMDIATMAYSVEARAPFLDHKLMEFAASVPVRHKVAGGTGKRLLRGVLRDRVPREILERPKMGFGVPLARWFRDELRDLPSDVLLDPRAIERGYFRKKEIERLIHEHQNAQGDHSQRLWALLQLEMWHREVVEAPRVPDAANAVSAS